MHRSHPKGRTLHVIDIENLVGGTAVGAAAVGPALAAYRCTVAVRPDDHVELGSGPTLAVAAGLAWPGARLRVDHGANGADRVLLDALTPDFIATHYDRVVIASGDHAFAPLAVALRSRRVAVMTIVRDRTTLARDLRRVTMHRALSLAS